MPDRPFRFGLHFWDLPAGDWVRRVRRYESLGFSTITFTDHQIVPQWEPLSALGALAAVTDRLTLGSLVLDMALRNPVLTAKSAATIELISGGRLELGLGAGYVARNFQAVGVPFASAADRIAQLEESIDVMRSLWSQPSTTFEGRFYRVHDAPMVVRAPVSPRLLIGGGGPKVMALGGRVADVVSVIPRQDTGDWSLADSLADSTLERIAEKVAWVRQGAAAAGRDPDGIELNTMAARVIVGEHVDDKVAQAAEEAGTTPDKLQDSTLFLCGSGSQVRDKLQQLRREAGISYVSLFDVPDEQVDYLVAEVVRPLSG